MLLYLKSTKLVRDFMAKKEEQNEHHNEGNGRVSQAAGKGLIYSAIAGVTVGVATFAATQNMGRAIVAAEVAAGLAFMGGSFHGWKKADTAIQDYDKLAEQNEQLTNFVVKAVKNQGTLVTQEKGVQVG
jgi:hypothetical protein